MEKKSLVLIIAGIAVFTVVFLGHVGNFNHEQYFIVGDLEFTVPDGFEYGGLNENGDPSLTNGDNEIFLTYYNDSNIKGIINSYVDEREANNRTITISNFKVNDIVVYKSDSSAKSNHYWFVSGDKTYSIFTWKETPNIDNITKTLISSAIN